MPGLSFLGLLTKNRLLSDYKRTQAVWYAKRLLFLPYLWGGDDPMAGFDCSGLVLEVLQSVGKIKHKIDMTADSLYKSFMDKQVPKGYAGCLVFWFKGTKAAHVEMMINDCFLIGSSGGSSKTLNRQQAIEQNAFIKMRPLGYRRGPYKIVDPFMVKKK
ncbi:MAG: C40 family peptidase [Desulfobacterales bacterium]|nr:C40 family peptidase [Desulfobacterales bacterium]